MYIFEDLEKNILKKVEDTNEEFERVFHGRGGTYKAWEFLTVDSIGAVLSIAYFDEIEESIQDQLFGLWCKCFATGKYEGIVLQKRYLPKAPSEVIFGSLPSPLYAIENGLSYKLNLLNNQNSGFIQRPSNCTTQI